MKSIEKAEDLVRGGKVDIPTDPQMDRRVLDDSFAAMDETIAARGLSVPGMILRSRAAKLSVAALIVIAVGLLVTQSGPPDREPPETANVLESPAEMLTVRSLMTSFHHGGIEAIQKQFDKALEMQEPQIDVLSMKELVTKIEFDLERAGL